MERKPKFALIHGIINVLLPVIPVLMHRGVFGVAENTWQYIWLIFAVQVVPPLSSLAGIVIAGIQLKRPAHPPSESDYCCPAAGLHCTSFSDLF